MRRSHTRDQRHNRPPRCRCLALTVTIRAHSRVPGQSFSSTQRSPHAPFSQTRFSRQSHHYCIERLLHSAPYQLHTPVFPGMDAQRYSRPYIPRPGRLDLHYSRYLQGRYRLSTPSLPQERLPDSQNLRDMPGCSDSTSEAITVDLTDGGFITAAVSATQT